MMGSENVLIDNSENKEKSIYCEVFMNKHNMLIFLLTTNFIGCRIIFASIIEKRSVNYVSSSKT